MQRNPLLHTVFCFLSLMCSLNAFADADDKSEASKRRLLGLVEYISGDYPGAVSEGRVVNDGEYEEMKEFARTAEDIARQLSSQVASNTYQPIANALSQLKTCINEMCAYEKVLQHTHFLRERLIRDFGLNASPSHRPDFELGRTVFMKNCASCHGEQGKGDGPLAAKLNPPPRSFHDASAMEQSSPFKFLNTLHTGIAGTGMTSFEGVLTEDEMWSVSFYIMGLRFARDPKQNVHTEADKEWDWRVGREPSFLPPDLSFLATMSNSDLQSWIRKSYSPIVPTEDQLRFLRTLAPYASKLPLKGTAVGDAFPWDFIRKQLKVAEEKFQAGQFQEASESLLDAYLDGFESIEAALAVADHGLLLNVERTFSIARSYASKGDAENFRNIMPELENLTKQAQLKLMKTKDTSGKWSATEFLSSLVIILREGFEAFLIIAALLMIVANLQARGARIWIHAGWFSALILGIASYFVFENVLKISGAARETIEAFCTLAATVVLFYTGFWLLSQAEHTRWHRYIKDKTSNAVSSQRLWVLFGISFIAVFRESAETVLFYSALLSSANSPLAVLTGFVVGLMTLFIVCFGILKFQVRLPLKQFFLLTSSFMVLLSIILAGKTVHELIAAGYLKATPLNFLPVADVLGIYPLRETFFAQCFVIALTALLLFKNYRRARAS